MVVTVSFRSHDVEPANHSASKWMKEMYEQEPTKSITQRRKTSMNTIEAGVGHEHMRWTEDDSHK